MELRVLDEVRWHDAWSFGCLLALMIVFAAAAGSGVAFRLMRFY